MLNRQATELQLIKYKIIKNLVTIQSIEKNKVINNL